MSVQRIYRPGLLQESNQEELESEDYHYIRNVLRLKTGDRLVLFDGRGIEAQAVIHSYGKNSVLVDITATDRIKDDKPPLILAQSLPKDNKMDLIVQKATELGAASIIPFTSARSIPRLTSDKAAARVRRWGKIASEAAKQCGSASVPSVSDILSFRDMLGVAPGNSIKLFFWEEETRQGIEDVLHGKNGYNHSPFFIVVGPEGGFSRDEADEARACGFLTTHLGKRILRVETASLVILSIIQYKRGSMRLDGKQKGV